ncbi:FdhF/YdeP family oxidoreductase [Parvicella tangerina]|uniref:Oxidoreductase n=1 Tax=Parvicella tangerina TaxID=2829795 RepID=A0A916JML9_9FLAO|nr:FdhF/YdeP family oxidoreductase [Parvicella tangerina]CAG5081075.1 putative oxidoreductase [Parvicella tangerina]
MSKRKVRIVPPENFSENFKLITPKEKAVGLPAITSAMHHLAEEMGLLKGLKVISKMNQKGGFDCPGCAWPDPDDHRSSLGEYCENGAKALAEEATTKRVDPEFFKKYSVEEMSEWDDYTIGKSGRITHPMILRSGKSHYEPISWEDAFKHIADKLKALNNPDEAVFYTSGRTANETAFLYQLFAKQFGTNNLPDCSNMCHESSGSGLSETVGIGKGSVTLEDLHKADVIIVMGQNPGTNHPRMLSALEKCKKNGGKIVQVNPIPEAGTNAFIDPQSPISILKGGTQLSDLFLQVKINGDIAILKATMKLLLEKEKEQPGKVFDQEFIRTYAAGYDELIADLEKQDLTTLIAQSGVEKSQIETLVNYLVPTQKIIICWAMGLTQHENGVENIREVVNLLLLKGAIGIEGAGTCPVRGHSNVQGDRTMGIYEKPPTSLLDAIDKNFGITSPREHGYDVVDAIKAMNNNKVKVFMAMGGNFISATPDSQLTGEAIQNCDLTVQVSTKLNRAHLVTGKEALILPCIARSEQDIQSEGPQFVSMENSMGIVHSSQGTATPASEHLLSEVAIVCGIANATFGNSPINWEKYEQNYDFIRDEIERTIPGFDNYNQRVRIKKGFYLPNGARERKFNTKNGKANFTVNNVPNHQIDDKHFIMMTIRTHDQYNTTIYGMDDRYRGILNERRVILMNPDDMKATGLKKFDIVDLHSKYAGDVRKAINFKVIPFNIAKGCTATYFPEANVLVPIDSVAKISNTPASKFIVIEIIKK